MKMRTLMMSSLFTLLIACMAFVGGTDSANFIPQQGFVPDEATAIKIAEAVLGPIYGRAKVEEEKPFKASLSSNTWVVTGTLQSGHVGGVAVVTISKRDARIISVIHGR